MSETKLNKALYQLLAQIDDTLLIVRTDECVRVGPYSIIADGDYFSLAKGEIKIEVFNNKKAAIAYAISKFYHHRTMINTIKKYDNKIGKYREDITFYHRGVQVAQQQNDSFKEDIMANRLETAFQELNLTKHSLLQEIKKIRFA